MITAVIEPIWRDRMSTAMRILRRVENILDWAIARGHRQGPNPARWKGHMENLLPKPAKGTNIKHHAALAGGAGLHGHIAGAARLCDAGPTIHDPDRQPIRRPHRSPVGAAGPSSPPEDRQPRPYASALSGDLQLHVYIVQPDHNGIATLKAAGEVLAPGDLLDQKLVAPISYGHGVRASQGIILQCHQGSFRYGTADKLEAIERENPDHALAVVIHNAIGLKCECHAASQEYQGDRPSVLTIGHFCKLNPIIRQILIV